MTKLVLDAKALAETLSLSLNTVRQYASRSPELLPPRLKHPGRKLLWAVEDVEAWVNAHRTSTQVPLPLGCSTPAMN